MSTIRCPSCGSPTAAAERYCRRCGNDLTAPAALFALSTAREDERTEVIDATGRTDLVASSHGRLGAAPAAPAGTPARRGPVRPGPLGPPTDPSRPLGTRVARGRRLAGVLVAVLGLLLLGAAGLAGYRALGDRRPAAGSTAGPTGASSPSSPSSPGGPTGSAGPTAPAGPPPLVAAAPALADRPETGPVVRLLTSYFGAINDRDFATARGTLVNRVGLPQTEDEFRAEYRSTRDSDVRLLGLQPDGAGGYVASVTFTSRQDPADAPDHSSPCLVWSVAYPLVRVDGTLRIDAVRTSNAAHRPC